jgi:NTP pyrophosphatase (non-canonical NTP hydrolase)
MVAGIGAPGRGIDRLQRYYRLAASRRGWDKESPRDALLLLTEELGELARAVRKLEGLDRNHDLDEIGNVGEELADLQLYIVHLANTLGLELANAVTTKEQVNARRSELSRDAA